MISVRSSVGGLRGRGGVISGGAASGFGVSCAALEQKYRDAGWKDASIYMMQNGHVRLRVTLRAPEAWERAR